MSNDNIEFGKRITKARKDLDMTMKELGKIVNLHESTIQRYESGKIERLEIGKAVEFAKALKTSKEINANNTTEKEVYNKVEYALKSLVDLGEQKTKLEEMKENIKINVGNVTDEDIKKQEETIKKYETEVEVAFETVLEYLELGK